jgi:hypothetical protein
MDSSNLVSAHKRAKHFGSLKFDGPFSVLGSTGPFIAARNYCMLLDATDTPQNKGLRTFSSVNDALEELVLLDSWARAINAYCDSHMIANDEDAKLAFACFHSRLFVDPSKLVK